MVVRFHLSQDVLDEDVRLLQASLNHLCKWLKEKTVEFPEMKIEANIHADGFKSSFKLKRTKQIFQMATSLFQPFIEKISLIKCYLGSKAVAVCITTLVRIFGKSDIIKCYCKEEQENH